MSTLGRQDARPTAEGTAASSAGVMRWSGAVRRHVAALLVGMLLVGLWLASGMLWQPPVAAGLAALLVRLLGRVIGRAVLGGPCRTMVVAGVVGTAVLARELSLAGGVLAAGVLLAATILVVGDRLGRSPGRHRRREPRDGRRRGQNPAHVLLVLAVVLSLGGAAGLVVEHVQAQKRDAAQSTQIAAFRRAQLLPSSPARAARLLLAAVADRDSTACTATLSPVAADQLARAVGQPDCAAAVWALAARVTDPRRYREPDSGATPTRVSVDGQLDAIDLCHMTWEGVAAVLNGQSSSTGQIAGPQLGVIDLARIFGQGYQIVGFRPC